MNLYVLPPDSAAPASLAALEVLCVNGLILPGRSMLQSRPQGDAMLTRAAIHLAAGPATSARLVDATTGSFHVVACKADRSDATTADTRRPWINARLAAPPRWWADGGGPKGVALGAPGSVLSIEDAFDPAREASCLPWSSDLPGRSVLSFPSGGGPGTVFLAAPRGVPLETWLQNQGAALATPFRLVAPVVVVGEEATVAGASARQRVLNEAAADAAAAAAAKAADPVSRFSGAWAGAKKEGAAGNPLRDLERWLAIAIVESEAV